MRAVTTGPAEGGEPVPRPEAARPEAARPEAPRPDVEQERWYLNDQREFLLRSIDDAERELDAGDLTRADFDVLVLRDRQRLSEVEAELVALGPEVPNERDPTESVSSPAERSDRRRFGPWRRVGIVVSCLLILAGAVILVNHAVHPSQPGQALTGSVTQPKVEKIAEQLTDAADLNNNGDALQALELYQTVLAEDPTDPIALAASGWLDWKFGKAGKSPTLESAGRKAEKKAIANAPSYYAGHLFLGLILLNQDHNAAGAIEQFTKFLADEPPDAELVSVAGLVASGYKEAHVPYPAKLAASVATAKANAKANAKTTTTTSAP